MPRKLTDAQVVQYKQDGFCFPLSAFSPAEMADRRQRLEAFEQGQGHPLQGPQRIKTSLLLKWVDDLMRDARILDAVEDVIGPDILCWGVNFWTKEPHSPDYVSWHQDHQYWGLDSAEVVSAWIAFSPATVESGCMRMQPGTHKVQLPHQDRYDKTNMLSRGQMITAGIDDSHAVNIVLQPGEMSLHNVRIAHASGPNRSDDRRIGLAIRYMPPQTRQQLGTWDSAALVRGQDRYGHFAHEPIPTKDFDPACVAFHAKTTENLLSLLYQGAEQRRTEYEENSVERV
ncbi:MAG: phytanoyl-CoA dioxygenase family protein [Candidatus Binatia bacterium]